MNHGLSNLKHTETISSKGTHTVVLNQYYKQIPIEGGEYRVHILENGSVDMVNGHYYPAIDIDTNSFLTEHVALATARADAQISLDTRVNKAELVILPENDSTFSLAYKTELYSNEPMEHWLYYINAKDGQTINKVNKLSHFSSLNTEKRLVTGTGSVYSSHPNASSLTTKNLYRLVGNNKLDGTYVKVLEYPGNSGVTGSNNNFIYSAGNPGIDETMSYYHVDDFRHNYINSIDNNFSMSKIEVLVNAQIVTQLGNCNGVYNSINHEILLSDGDGINCFNASLEDKIIQHEYTHAVTYKLNSGVNSNNSNEEGAINEGLADYFPGSYKNKDNIGDYLAPDDGFGLDLERDMGAPEFASYTDYLNDVNYPNVNINKGGEFFSSILWDIRNSSGIANSIIDEIIFEAIKSVNSNPDFMDFRDMMKTKANSCCGYTYVKTIHNRFADKGIGVPYPLTVTIAGPIEMDAGTSKTWTASSDGVAPFTYEWRVIPLGQGGTGTVVGTNSSYTGTHNDSFDLLVSMTDGNSYSGSDRHFVTVDDGGGCPPTFPCKTAAESLPTEFGLSDNYPNPFNPSTQIKFDLPEIASVTLNVYNIMGQRVATLINSEMQAGFYTKTFESSNLPSGVYIARLTAIGSSRKQFTQEIKMQLIK